LGRTPLLREARVVALVFESEVYEALKQLARARRASVSAVVRELVEQYLKSEGVLPTVQAASLKTDGGPALPSLDGNGFARLETDSERRWRLLTKLDEPMVEGLVKDVEKLERMVAELEREAVSKRLTEAFLARRRAARRKLVDLKKVARYLIRAGADVSEEVVDSLARIERALNSLD